MAGELDTSVGLLQSLFEDGGESLLVEAGLPTDWRQVLAPIPSRMLPVPPADDPDRAARLLSRLRDLWAARQMWRPALAATRALMRVYVSRWGADHPQALAELGAMGALAHRTGRTAEGAGMLQQAWEGLRSVAGGRDLRLAVVCANLGSIEIARGRHDRAIELFETAWRIRKEVAPKTVGMVAAQLAELLLEARQVDRAAPVLEDALEGLRASLGPAHKRTITVGRQLAQAHIRAGKPLKAELVLRELHEQVQASPDPELRYAVTFELGVALRRVRLDDEAGRYLEEAVLWTRRAGDPHPALPERLSVWADVLITDRRRITEGEAALREALEAERTLYGDDSPEVGVRYAALGHLCAQLDRHDEALGYLDPAASLLRGTYGDAHPATQTAVRHLLEVLIEGAKRALQGRDKPLAQALAARAREVGPPVLGFSDRLVLAARDLPV